MKMRISFHSYCAMGNPCLSSYLIFFFTVPVSTLEPVNFQVIGPDHPVMVFAGEDALLPCHLSPSMSAQEMEVRWFRSKFSEPVHLYQHGEDQAEQQIPNYQGRTELLKDGIVNGSVVLSIRNINPSDHGQFICFFRSHSSYVQAILELKVADPFFLRGYPWKVAVYILLVVVGLLTFTASYFFWTQHKAKEAHAAERGKLVADLEKLQVELEKLQADLRWRKTQVYGEVKVTLDPDTAHRGLKLSEDQKTVTWESKHQDLPDNPERFDEVFCVLGSPGFTSGRIYWEVEGMGRIWAIGVARESVKRKGQIKFTPEEGIWGIEQSRGHYSLLTTPEIPLPLCETPKKVRIYVNYENGQVAFFNPDNGDLIANLTASFNGEKIFPFFWVCSHLTLTI